MGHPILIEVFMAVPGPSFLVTIVIFVEILISVSFGAQILRYSLFNCVALFVVLGLLWRFFFPDFSKVDPFSEMGSSPFRFMDVWSTPKSMHVFYSTPWTSENGHRHLDWSDRHHDWRPSQCRFQMFLMKAGIGWWRKKKLGKSNHWDFHELN